MRQDHKAGEKLFVDYSGMTMSVLDPKTGEARQAETESVNDFETQSRVY